jgi:para-nitrobenzyl esterase
MQEHNSIPGLAIENTSEDCLYLNVWTPSDSEGGALAVMVFLHGGGGTTGSGSQRLYSGEAFARRNVVFVSINYRLGSFAYLAHPELTAESANHSSGNYALLDIIAALKWVQNNIEAFGGDPQNVTLFGQSAGAYYASQLVVSPLARGLFARVIAQSGGNFGPTGLDGDFPSLAEAEQLGVDFANELGAISLAELRSIPAEEIVMADSQARFVHGLSRGLNFPNIDGFVIPKNVYELYAEGQVHEVDLLVGFNADEGANTIGEPLPVNEYITETRNRYGDLADEFLAEYPASSDEEAASSQVRMKSAATAWRGTVWAQLHNPLQSRTFLYRFSHVPPFQPFSDLNAAGHGAELGYVFGYPSDTAFFLFLSPLEAYRNVRLARRMQAYWTNFARTGDPNGWGLPEWPEFDSVMQLLEIGVSVEQIEIPNREELKLVERHFGVTK